MKDIIYQRGSLLYTDVEVAGQRIRRSTGFHVGQEAQARLVAARIAAGETPAPVHGRTVTGMTLAQAVTRMGQTRWRDVKSQRLVQSQTSILLRNMGAATLLSEITPDRIAKYLRDMESEGLMPSTFNGRVACLRTLLVEAVQWGAIAAAPAIPRKKPRSVQRHYLSAEDAARVIAMEPIPHYRSLWTFLLHTGVRIGEAMRVTPAQIVGGTVQLIDTKNGKNRAVPLTPQALEAATSPGDPPRARYGYSKETLDQHVADGRLWPMGYRGYLVAWTAAITRAGLTLAPGTGVHITRHTAATQLLSQGADIREVQEWLGHSSIQQTAVYAKVTPQRMNRLRDLMGAVLDNPKA